MNKFKQEWFIDYNPTRLTPSSMLYQPKPADEKPKSTRWGNHLDSAPLTDQQGKITVKA